MWGFVAFFVEWDSKLSTFSFWTVGLTKRANWRPYCGFWEIVNAIISQFSIEQIINWENNLQIIYLFYIKQVFCVHVFCRNGSHTTSTEFAIFAAQKKILGWCSCVIKSYFESANTETPLAPHESQCEKVYDSWISLPVSQMPADDSQLISDRRSQLSPTQPPRPPATILLTVARAHTHTHHHTS